MSPSWMENKKSHKKYHNRISSVNPFDLNFFSFDKNPSTLFKLISPFHQNLKTDLPFRETSSRARTSQLFKNLTNIFNQNHMKMIKDKNFEDSDDGYNSSNGDLDLN